MLHKPIPAGQKCIEKPATVERKHNCYLVLAGITIIIPFRFNNRKRNLLRESAYIMEIEVNILLWIANLILGTTPKWLPLLIISRKPNRHNNTK